MVNSKDELERYELGLPELSHCFMQESVHCATIGGVSLWFYNHSADMKWLENLVSPGGFSWNGETLTSWERILL